MMQGWSYDAFGPVAKVLKLSTLPMPELLGGDDVLVKVHCAAINPTDTKQIQGSLNPLLVQDKPMKPGMDFSGVVVKTGSRVQRLKEGDAVMGMVRGVRTGTTCEFIVVDQAAVSLKPQALCFVDAAAIPLAAMTAMQCLREAGLAYPPDAAAKDKSVFVSGGPGGVGNFAVQLAKHMFGVGRVVTTASTTKVALCKDVLGADEVIDYTKQSFASALSGQSFDALIDCTGDAWSMVPLAKHDGAVISVLSAPTKDILIRWKTHNMGEHPGMTLRGPVDFAISNVPGPVLDFFTGAFFYRLRGRANNVKYNHIICIPRHEDLDAIAALVVSGKVKVVIDQVVPFDRAADAYVRVDSGKAVGKVVVQVVAAAAAAASSSS